MGRGVEDSPGGSGRHKVHDVGTQGAIFWNVRVGTATVERALWPRSSDWTLACEDWPSAGTVYLRFGSWQAALEIAMSDDDGATGEE